MDVRNPLVAILKGIKCTAKDFCLIYGCSLNSMRMATSGHSDKIAKGIKDAMVRAGIEISGIDEQYRNWQLLTANERIKKLQ